MSLEREHRPDRVDEIPRLGFWAALPKRTLSRVVFLLVVFAAIIYLRQRAPSIAGCLSDNFHVPPPAPQVKLKAASVPSAQPSEASAR
jgi:hypothetical protein